MATRAFDIYNQLLTLRFQLEQLADQGRIVMARDGLNSDHPDSAAAVTKALAGIDQAIDATCWMETVATLDGTYPELKD